MNPVGHSASPYFLCGSYQAWQRSCDRCPSTTPPGAFAGRAVGRHLLSRCGIGSALSPPRASTIVEDHVRRLDVAIEGLCRIQEPAGGIVNLSRGGMLLRSVARWLSAGKSLARL